MDLFVEAADKLSEIENIDIWNEQIENIKTLVSVIG